MPSVSMEYMCAKLVVDSLSHLFYYSTYTHVHTLTHNDWMDERVSADQSYLCCSDRHDGLPIDSSLWHALHRGRYLRLLLDAEATQSTDGTSLDADQSQCVLPRCTWPHAACHRLLHPWHQCRVSSTLVLVLPACLPQ